MNARLLNAQPWRFEPGQLVYVRGWPVDETAKVIDRALVSPFPAYYVVDNVGIEWCIAQAKLSSRPIPQP